MSKPNEYWKTVIHSEENMADAMRNFVDDYITLVNYWRENEEKWDDATWVHVDCVREEREELESRIQQLEHALDLRNEEYNDLATKHKELQKEFNALQNQLNNSIEDEVKPQIEPPKEVKRLVKKKKKLIVKSK